MTRFLELITLLLIFVALFLLFFLKFHWKRQFRSIKKKYGIAKDELHQIQTLSGLFLRFNEMSDRPISFDDFTIITLDGSFIPLFCGNVGYKTSPLMDTWPFFPTVIFSVVDSEDLETIVLNRQDLFELTTQKENISVFLVRDLRKLAFHLRRQQRQNSAHGN